MKCRTLSLADGCVWRLTAEAAAALPVMELLGEVMQLPVAAGATPTATRELWLGASDQPAALVNSLPVAARALRQGVPARCLVDLPTDPEQLLSQAIYLTSLLGAEVLARGGALMHAALATYPSPSGLQGVLLAGPSGTGKTTASHRLPFPWVSLSDDTALVVRDPDGVYWAHPWPTWSRFIDGGPGGTWPTTRAVRLAALVVLEQAEVDVAAPLGGGHAAAALVQSIGQVSSLMTRRTDEAMARALRLEWFAVASALARVLPCLHLRFTLTGAFWHELERYLDQGRPSPAHGADAADVAGVAA